MAHPAKKKVIIIGATSGIGRELALMYLSRHHMVGITGRRTEALHAIKERYPENTHCQTMDVQSEKCIEALDELIEAMQGVDRIICCAGIGHQNPSLDPLVEMNTVYTNVNGFTRVIIYAYNYFKTQGIPGHIVAFSSIAGIRPLRQAPAYSATKRYQAHYISCLAQRANKEKRPIKFTTILPGFIQTELLSREYPLTISLEKGAPLLFKAIEREKRTTILPGRWRWLVFLWKLIPNALWEKVW